MFQTIEICLIFLIISVQCWIAVITWLKIKAFKEVFPEATYYFLGRVYLSDNNLGTINPREIIANAAKYSDPSQPAVIPINIVGNRSFSSEIFKTIQDSLNSYLIRNRNAVPEFNLVKDIVERNCGALEEDINITISVPLYLGLLGTLIGVIFGLFNISALSEGASMDMDALNKAIPVLLGGVKIAMIASFTGLALTIVNSAWFLRQAKVQLETKKNEFYTFLQIELMPLLNQGINATIHSLQANLFKFNDDFTGNLNKLGKLMYQNHDAILAQEKILTSLENIDPNTLVKTNLTVMTEFKKSVESLQVFNLYMKRVEETLHNTGTVVVKLTQFIDKTEAMGTMAININKSFEENARLIKFFNDHQTSLDNSKQVLAESVGTVSKALKDAISEMELETRNRIIQMKNLMTAEINKMESEYPEQWKKLDNLEEIKKEISEIRQNVGGQTNGIEKEMKGIKEYLKSMEEGMRMKQVELHTNWVKKMLNKYFSKSI